MFPLTAGYLFDIILNIPIAFLVLLPFLNKKWSCFMFRPILSSSIKLRILAVSWWSCCRCNSVPVVSSGDRSLSHPKILWTTLRSSWFCARVQSTLLYRGVQLLQQLRWYVIITWSLLPPQNLYCPHYLGLQSAWSFGVLVYRFFLSSINIAVLYCLVEFFYVLYFSHKLRIFWSSMITLFSLLQVFILLFFVYSISLMLLI